jgi:hypothetical protein
MIAAFLSGPLRRLFPPSPPPQQGLPLEVNIYLTRIDLMHMVRYKMTDPLQHRPYREYMSHIFTSEAVLMCAVKGEADFIKLVRGEPVDDDPLCTRGNTPATIEL